MVTPSLSLKYFSQEKWNISMKPSMISADRGAFLQGHYSKLNVSVVLHLYNGK